MTGDKIPQDSAVRPVSVWIVGLASIFGGAILVLLNLLNLVSPNEIDAAMKMMRLYAPGIDFSISGTLRTLFGFQKGWSGVQALYFIFVIFAAAQFLKLRESGRRKMELACVVGIAMGAVETVLSYLVWRETQSALTGLLKGLGGGQYTLLSPVGSIMIILGFLLWLIPCLGLIFYFRRPAIRLLMR